MSFEAAMFPLGSVLLPGTLLPLHIFEDRYRMMITDVLAGDGQFGVSFIARGHEVGGGEVRTPVGVMATIVEASRFEDGRWAIGALAGRRFRVSDWLADDPYPRAMIDWWEDLPGESIPAELLNRSLELINTVGDMASELGYTSPPIPESLPSDPVELSYLLTSIAPLGPSDRFDLLCAQGAPQRILLLEQRLQDQQILFGAQLAMGGGEGIGS
jgi:Lon protease-like protein